MLFSQLLNSHKIFKRLAKALIRLRVCAYAQAGLNFCWSQIPHCWKSHVAAYLSLYIVCYNN